MSISDSYTGSNAAGSDGRPSTASGKAPDAVSDAVSSVSKMAAGVGQNLREGVEAQKNAGADVVSSLARSAKDAADNMQQSSPEIARLVRTSADAVENASKNFKEQSLGDMLDSAGDFAARQPVAFFGCGILAGLLISRLFSSPSR